MSRPDVQRIAANRQALLDGHLEAIVCAVPANVLLFSGYCPVVGSSVLVATPHTTRLIVPTDERDQAEAGFADGVRTFEAGSIHSLPTLPEAVRPALADTLMALNLRRGRIGYEFGPWVQPAPYAAATTYGPSLPALLSDCVPDATLVDTDATLRRLRSVKTPTEIGHIRGACQIAAAAFADGVTGLRPGRTETQVAADFEAGLLRSYGGIRVAGDVFCMSGPNAAMAHAAFERSHQRELRPGDVVLVHCNSNSNGYWTDITRTYHLGPPAARQRQWYDAVFAARSAALAAIRPGALACDVDRAARSVLADRGFGDAFKHSTGHGVGFAAIDHNAAPRVHPVSTDTLEVGMVFNVEPAVYFDGEGGVRQCEMVAVGEHGAELLTDFQNRFEQLVLA